MEHSLSDRNKLRNVCAATLLLLLWTSCQPEPVVVKNELQQIRAQAVKYLLSQQAEDGGWHSTTHGVLRGGQAYTPYVVDILLLLPDSMEGVEASMAKGFWFMQSRLDSSGVLGRYDSQLAEYPVYATALAYKSWRACSISSDSLMPIPSLDFLLRQQFTEQRGIKPDHPAYGGWGFGEENLPYGEVGHLDLSHTRRVLEALRGRDLPDTSRVWGAATQFLQHLQQPDGGFCASTYTLGANKADDHDASCVSYATATADGVLSLLALPNPPAESIHKAKDWLLRHADWSAPPGIQAGRPGDWDKVLYYYHLSVRAQAYAALSIDSDWPVELLHQIGEKQSADGSFSNPWGAPNKEDDPLLATALVIKAINAAVGD